MLTWLKWKLAGDELAELGRWRSSWVAHRRWFAEFDAAATVLDHMQCEVSQKLNPKRPMGSIMYERDNLRKRVTPNNQVERPL